MMQELYIEKFMECSVPGYIIYHNGKVCYVLLKEPLNKKHLNKLITHKTSQHIDKILRKINNKKSRYVYLSDNHNNHIKSFKKKVLKLKLSSV